MNIFPISQRPIVPFDLLDEDNVLRSEPTAGPVMKRLRFPESREGTMGRFTWQYLSDDDHDKLVEFYHDNSALPFEFTYYIKSKMVTKIVTFKEPPKRSYAGSGWWQVQCTFEEV